MKLLALFSSQIGTHVPPNIDSHSWILHWLTCSNMVGSQLFCVILWKLWDARNQMVFNNIKTDPSLIAQTAHEYVSEFNLANPRAEKNSSKCL